MVASNAVSRTVVAGGDIPIARISFYDDFFLVALVTLTKVLYSEVLSTDWPIRASRSEIARRLEPSAEHSTLSNALQVSQVDPLRSQRGKVVRIFRIPTSQVQLCGLQWLPSRPPYSEQVQSKSNATYGPG